MLSKRRLLLIDSSDSARTILFKEISRQMPDLDIIACATAKEAISAIKRFNFEIITTGISLPDMDGYQLISEIRKSSKNRDTAIFVVSGDTNTRIMGADDDDTNAVTAYFDKAEGHQALVNFILNFLGKDTEIPVKILYVDKSATSTAITSSILKKNNINFSHFGEAQEALEHLQQDIEQNLKCSFDVMITDLMLSSDLSGFDLIQRVRNELKLDYLTLPILLMTIEPGEDEKTDFTGIFGAGTNDFITKPIDEEDLLKRILTLLNIKRQNDALNL
ncbi:MAG: DNA-binding response OmpR family regulator [Gammaproteobacteria bacterium]|jgi:DNA-binding response OmpR family regulator